MIPSPWVALVLALAAYRVTRLVGWDDLPPIVRVRAWVVGAELVYAPRSINQGLGITDEDEPEPVWRHRRPVLAHFIACPFCVGFWLACVLYVWWLLSPVTCLYGMAPFALGAAVGLVAKNLDP